MENFEKTNNGRNGDMFQKIALAALLGIFGTVVGASKNSNATNDMRDAIAQSASIKDMRDSVSDRKGMAEQLRLEIIKKQNEIKNLAYQEGQSIDFNGQKAIKYVNKANGDVFIVGNIDGKTWMSLTTSNNYLTYLASNDGIPNSVVVDSEGNISDVEKNLTYALEDIDQLWAMTGTFNKPEKKKRFELLKINGENLVKGVDLEKGKRATKDGGEADDIVEDVSKSYFDHLKSI